MAEQRRCEAISDFLRRLQRRLQISTQGEMARELGLTESTYKARLKNPSKFTIIDLWNIQTVGRRAGMEFKEVGFL